MNHVFPWLTSACLSVAILSLALLIHTDTASIHRALFSRTGTYNRTAQTAADTYDQHLVYFLRTGSQTAIGQLPLSEGEYAHMDDVYAILRLLRGLTAVLLLMVVCGMSRGDTASVLFRSGIILIFSTILGACASFLSFDVAFNALHYAIFPEGTWMFPEDALLIRLYSESFFEMITASIGVVVFSVGVVLIGVSRLRITNCSLKISNQ